MGFHPDFTGRQNVYGRTVAAGESDIDKLMPNIEKFAEIGEYIDQPVASVKWHAGSIGFQRCTQRPEVLIIDEALSVGDLFQHKVCRIREFRELGTTLLSYPMIVVRFKVCVIELSS